MEPAASPVISPRKMRIANAVYFFVSGFGYTTWASRIPFIMQQMHLNKAQLGAALFALPIGLIVTLPVTSRLLTVFSSSLIMLIGSVAFNLMLALLGYTAYYWQLIGILFFFGSSRNLLNLSVNTQAVGVQKFYTKSIITTFHGIWSTAGLCGVFTGWLMVYFNISTNWHLLGVSIILCMLSIAFFPNALHQKPERGERKPIFILPDKALLKFALICFASMACENVMYDWSGVYIQNTVHASKTTVTTGFLLFMISVTSGRFIGDRIVSRWGIKRLLTGGSVLIVLGFMVAILFPYVPSAVAGFGLIGLGVSCIVPLVYSQAAKSKTMSGGPAIAAVSTIGYLGFLFVPPFVGFVAQAAGLRWAFAIISLLGLVILWMTGKINEGE